VTTFREHVDLLRSTDELVSVTERVHWADTAPAVGAEAVRTNGPAVVLEDTVGYARLVAGAYSGRDRMAVRETPQWSRLASGFGWDDPIAYADLLEKLGTLEPADAVDRGDLAAREVTGTDIRSLGLPAVGTTDIPAITLAMAALPDGTESRSDGSASGPDADEPATAWAPVRGSIHGSDRIRVVLPGGAADSLTPGDPASIALGVPAAALSTAIAGWTGERRHRDPVRVATGIDPELTVAAAAGGAVPVSTEVLIDGEVARRPTEPSGVTESWELAIETEPVELRVTSIATRDSPLVPFSPTKAPMADDYLLLGTLESARLYDRVNNYWGVAPVEWIAIPAEAKLGICLVASEILYAGFEWQLANALFSFSDLFDKVLVLDAETPPVDLARAFDDVWVKAHPAQDWEFSEPAAPAAAAPLYRRDDATGSNVYIDAAWDPRWDEEYIAPRVNFENSYPAEIRESVRERWLQLGFDRSEER
jgi:4-hydroxy-3-polyprenylbenzoate decarboxylase